MKVYTLTHESSTYDESDFDVVGVFKSRELAKRYMAKHYPDYTYAGNGYIKQAKHYTHTMYIEPFEVIEHVD